MNVRVLERELHFRFEILNRVTGGGGTVERSVDGAGGRRVVRCLGGRGYNRNWRTSSGPKTGILSF